jgi:hypothetical protein
LRDYDITTFEYNKLVAHIDKSLKYDKETIAIYVKLIKALKTYDGKILNLRIQNHISLEGYNVHYYKSYQRPFLYISNEYSRYEIQLASSSNDKYIKFDINYLIKGLEALKLKYEKNLKEIDNVAEYVCKFNIAVKLLEEAKNNLSNLPNWYGFSRFN